MTYPGIDLALRHLAALALVTSVACTVDNQAFMFGTDGTGTTSSSTGVSATGVEPDPTTSAATSQGATVTSDVGGSTGDVTATATSVATSVATSDTTGVDTAADTGAMDCVEWNSLDVPAAADAFFVSGSTNEGTKCGYPGGVLGADMAPCDQLNFGTTSALPFAKAEVNIESMYAVRFAHDPLIMLANSGAIVVSAQLNLTGWGEVQAPLNLEVSTIGDLWAEGGQNGTLALMGDSSFLYANLGIVATEWSGGDGPRGASEYLADMLVDIPTEDHFALISEEFPLGDDFLMQLGQLGLLVSYPLDTELFTYGPGLKSREAAEIYRPFIRIYYCMP